MPRSAIDTQLFTPIGPYSHAVAAGGHLYLSGTPGIDPATGKLTDASAYGQAAQALDNLIAMVKAAGGDERDLVTIQVHLIDVADFKDVNRAFEERLSEPYPARTVFGVAALPKEGALLTISGMAVLGK